jgi:hypothetical protein
VKARRVTVLRRPIEHNQSQRTESAPETSPWLAMDLVFRAPLTTQIAWVLGDEETRRVLELCQEVPWDKTPAWLEDSVAEIRWGSGGKHPSRGRPATADGHQPGPVARARGSARAGNPCRCAVSVPEPSSTLPDRVSNTARGPGN